MPGNRSLEEIIEIAHNIREYLSDHPEAADSLDGIVTWWLASQRYTQAAGDVQKALDYLVARGVAARNSTASGQVVYSATGWPANSKH